MKKKTITTIKILVFIVIVHGLMCITSSYVMAWCGIADTLESLSSVMVSEIVAPLTIYGVTKTLENIFAKNITTFSRPIENIEKVEG